MNVNRVESMTPEGGGRTKSALVLGATRGIGAEVATQLSARGWRVRALPKAGSRAQQASAITWLSGDVLKADDVRAAAQGMSAIVHAVTPDYRDRQRLALAMLDNTIAAAGAVGATIVLPATLHNYGPDAFPILTEESSQRPVTARGVIGVEMEQRLHEFALSGGRALIVRAGDLFGTAGEEGTSGGDSWFSPGLVLPRRPVTAISYPGVPGVGHQWAYLPDVARTMVELLERARALEPCATFHTAGHWDQDGSRMINAIRRVIVRATGDMPKVAAYPWWLLAASSALLGALKDLHEMQYLWQQPVRMDNSRLKAILGFEPHTALDAAVESTLYGLGCLGSGTRGGAPVRRPIAERPFQPNFRTPGVTHSP